ncbi:MAG: LysM peptidoglycan-binding domain-containing protein, partial [Pseudomonadota bacterium]
QAPPQVAASEADSPVVPPEPVAAAASAEPVVSPSAPPTVLEADADGVRVAQTAPDLTPPNIALDAITYDPDGDVQLAGRATGDGAVQVYIDNQPVTASPVQEGGDWRVDLPEIDTGVYTLRIDEVDSAGEVVSRLETPFRREEAADVAAVLAEETSAEGFEVAVKTVQPGATLWAIAEENLGSGILYVEVFEANADLIRDPDLIYPGQIFRIPDITQ